MNPEYEHQVTTLEEVEPSNKTYRLDFKSKRIVGNVDNLEAVTQSIYKILNTERQSQVIYDMDYGIELERFIGQDEDFVKADIQRTVTEAILSDDRVTEVSNFIIGDLNGDTLNISLDVETIFGTISVGSEVMI